MKILGIDTSSKWSNLSVIEDEEILIEYVVNGLHKKHSSILVQTIKKMLKNVDMKIGNIDGISVTIGPGSFTGLRIGLGTAKGLSYATSAPLFGIPTLDVLAYPLRKMPYLICPILDARKEEVYYAVYRGGDNIRKIIDYKCESINQLLSNFLSSNEDIVFLGEGLTKYQDVIKKKIGERAMIIDSTISLIHASNVAFMGLEKFKKDKSDDIYSFSPLYLRKSEAEIAWEKKNISI
ncbi:MAG: tRNA (adenosine(37)-N6)-threonylcarbamoyltransferase complex dimerization subunit type 1 TsaB [Candidatus Caldatribacteriota bacterium]|nr:tRNA (adenosine(37)-N6)-threonylcarbamoyltransferase complex dimerization subunit type 1 TsaB [Candidatus Caldatribacteriota bacterium]